MAGRRRVLGPLNGSPQAKVMLVGEAPGRRGAERTGVPFQGDESGRRLDLLLAAAGWERSQLFITNAVLCNPRDEAGRNRPPSRLELSNCRDHLAATLAVCEPILAVALGRRALSALGSVATHELDARAAPGLVVPWGRERWLTWLYHPSPLTQATRSFATQLEDWRRLSQSLCEMVERSG